MGKKKLPTTGAQASARLASHLDGKKSREGSWGGDEKPEEEMTEIQLVKKAEAIHKDTTATAQRALKIVEEGKQVKNTMLTELDKQNRKLERLDNEMHKMNEQLTYSEKILRYMRRCCCCWIFDSCTGADPEERQEAKWKNQTAKGDSGVGALYSGTPEKKHDAPSQHKATRSSGGVTDDEASPATTSKYRDPDTNLGEGHERTAMKLAAETRKQNEVIDQIHNGVDELLEGAKMINEELTRQDKIVEHLSTKTDKTQGRLSNMNNKSQLRKYK